MSYSCLLIHTILVCDGRRPLLLPDMREKLYPFLGAVVQRRKGSMLAANGVSDHVHVLLSLARTSAIADLMREMKAVSSRWIREELECPRFSWQAEYAAFSVSPSARPRVEAYIADQERHHQKYDLRQELLALLKAHGIQPDPRDRWLGAGQG